MKTVCTVDNCTGCMSCINICPVNAIDIQDQGDVLNAVINENICVNCKLCESVCQILDFPITNKPIKWFQGWNNNLTEREKSSSGGVAYIIAKQFIELGGFVCACAFINGGFKYKLVNQIQDLELFRGSKYVKSDPNNVYKRIKELIPSNKVLFIGLPCHVGGLKKYLNNINTDNLYTIDLICHGSPSPQLLEKFLNQYDYSLSSIHNIRFRNKGEFRLSVVSNELNDDNSHFFTVQGVKDKYMIAFLNGLIYTNNCYECRYAGISRIADLTLGDSWGSTLDENEKKKGISLILCQSEKGLSLLKNKDLCLNDVDIEKAVASNQQLRNPFPVPNKRNEFFANIHNTVSFNSAVKKVYKKECLRGNIKSLLVKTHLINMLRRGN